MVFETLSRVEILFGMSKSTSPGGLRQQQQEQTRAALLQAAAELFAVKGIAQTSLDDIAKAAGYTKGAIYSNFGSKDELVVELFDHNRRANADVADSFDRALLSGDTERAQEVMEACDQPEAMSTRLLGIEALMVARRNPDSSFAQAAGKWMDDALNQVADDQQNLTGADRESAIRYAVAATAMELGLELLRPSVDGLDYPKAYTDALRLLAAELGQEV